MSNVNIDWSSLGFSYTQTACHIQYVWKDGAWDEGRLVESPYIPIHIAAGGLHYGQECFEGIKVFRQKNGDVSIFRVRDNARRMFNTAERLCMATVPEDMFVDAIARVVKANLDYIPPYGTGGSLYVRPLLFGSGPQIGVAPAPEYTFIVLVTPVGAYYKGGLQPVKAIVIDHYDRAAPLGTGHVKCGGNYAASLYAHLEAKAKGYPVELYLDAKTHTYIEEFSTSNFLGITKDGKYVTPDSKSVLPSITNNSLMQVARDLGITVERRPVMRAELKDLAEVAACGTAVVITPVSRIYDGDKVYEYGDKVGATMQKIYDTLTGIQKGVVPDTHDWLVEVKR